MTNSLGNQEKSFAVPGSNLDCIYEMHENMNRIDYLLGVNFLFVHIFKASYILPETLNKYLFILDKTRDRNINSQRALKSGAARNLKTDFFKQSDKNDD